jgi:hypothetical protein
MGSLSTHFYTPETDLILRLLGMNGIAALQ